jgi:hypothetical protein
MAERVPGLSSVIQMTIDGVRRDMNWETQIRDHANERIESLRQLESGLIAQMEHNNEVAT